MSRTRTVIAAIGATAATASLALFAASGTAGAAPTPPTARLAGSVAPFTSTTRVTGTVPGSTKLTVQVWLKSRTTAAQQFDNAVSTPGSKSFHQYLSPDAYTARFGATPAAARNVEKWLRAEGFTGVAADSLRSYVRATGPASTIDAAFGVQLKLYKSTKAINAGPYRLRANDRAVSVPASLASSVTGVTGLDNAGPILPLETEATRPQARVDTAAKATPCSHYFAQHKIYNLPEKFGRTSFAVDNCGYTPRQIRGAYGASKANNGRGQTIALVELGLAPDMFKTLQDYAAVNHFTAPSARRYAELSIGRGTACGDDFFLEEQLDVEASYDMAPGASQVVVGGDSCNDGDYGLQGLFDADLAVLGGRHDRPLASAASNSWEGGTESQPASLTDIEHSYLVRSAAEGVGMYFSAGDGSGVLSPSSDPDAIAVGGTSLGISETGGRLFETGWSNGGFIDEDHKWENVGEDGATGGGPSLLWKQPSYQKGVVPARLARVAGNRSSGLVRSVPDISADADLDTGLAVGLIQPNSKGVETYGEIPVGGTSLSAPLVAGMVIAAQQGERPFGQIDPVVYKLSHTSALHDPRPLTAHTRALYRASLCRVVDCGILVLDRLDDQSKLMFGYTGQVTLKGYDNMTGVGTPNGQRFIAALRKLDD